MRIPNEVWRQVPAAFVRHGLDVKRITGVTDQQLLAYLQGRYPRKLFYGRRKFLRLRFVWRAAAAIAVLV